MPKARCAICGWKLGAERKTVSVGGRNVPVCCDECAAKAKKQGAKRSSGK